MKQYESPKDQVRRTQMQTFINPNSNILRTWYKKATSYGNMLEVLTLDNVKTTFRNKRNTYTKFMKTQRRKDAIFAKNIEDLKQANQYFKYFITKLNKYLTSNGYEKIKYLCVPEFQKRGAVHYHAVFLTYQK